MLQTFRKTFKDNKVLLQILVVFLGIFCGLNIFLYSQVSELLRDQVRQRSFTLAQTATAKDVVMRDWMATLGGIYVLVTDKTPPNPYLPVEGREVQLPNGKMLTKMNPAYVTRLVHDRWRESSTLPSRITSLKPVNQVNAPLPWETRGMETMGVTGQDFYTENVKKSNGEATTLYVQALYAKPACLTCHTTQGYKTNDLMGALSIEVPDAHMVGNMREIKYFFLGGYLLATLFMFFALIWGGRKLSKIQAAKQEVEFSLRRLAATLESKVLERTQDLEREKENIQTILSGTLEGILQIDGNGNVTYLNAAARDILGYENDEIIDQPSHDILSPAYTYNTCPLAAARHAGTRHMFTDHLMRHQNGQIIQVNGSVSPIQGAGNGKGSVVVFHRLNTADELSFLQKTIFANASDPFFIWDREETCLCNDAALHFLGAPDVESISNNYLDYCASQQNNGVPAKNAKTALFKECDEKGDLQAHWMHRHMDGTLLPCLMTVTKIQHHNYQGYFVSIKDLRPQLEFEQQLENEKTFLRTILDTIPDMIFYKSPEGVYMAGNKALARFLGSSQDGLVGKTDQQLFAFAIEQIGDFSDTDQHAISRGKGIRYEAKIMGYDGIKVQLDIIKTPCYSTNGALIGVLGIARDITSLVQAREEAMEASRAKSEFLARMSHEIRTPMNAILGMTYICLQNACDGSQLSSLNKILSAGKGLLSLINDILDVSKIEAGKMKLEKTPFNISEILTNLGAICSALNTEKNVEVLFHISPKLLVTFEGDSARLSQVLNNLLSNSMKFTENGEIVLRVTLVGRHGNHHNLKFEVSDTGIGMNASQINSIFKPFVQADVSTTRKYGGTGLGLVICQHFVQMMGGTFEVSSTPGVGSSFSFTISLPIFCTEEQVWDKTEGLESERLLVVDDNETARDVLMELLLGFGFRVDVVASGAEACMNVKEAINKGDPYSLILLDWRMPIMDGYECAMHINSLSASSPVKLVMISAFGQEEYTKKSGLLGLVDFIAKPIQPMELWGKVMKALGKEDLVPQTHNIRKIDEKLQMHAISGAQVLLVEDNETNQEVATRLMERMGMKVTIANNGLEAVNILKLKSFDLVFMDIQMPIMDGIEATKAIRNRPETAVDKLPIIAMTAHAMVEDKEKSLSVGMNEHITKPITPDTLAQVLLKWIQPKKQPASQQILDITPQEVTKPSVPEYHYPGVDWERGLYNIGNELDIFLKHLRRFPECYSNYANLLYQQSSVKDWNEAARLAHTLKGVAATLGMQKLAECASSLEKSCVEMQLPADSFAKLQFLLAEVCEGIEKAGHAPTEDPKVDAKNMDTSILEFTLRSLQQVFHTDVMECMETVQKINPFVPQFVTVDMYNRLHKAVYEFNEEKLIEAVQEALTALGKAPTNT